MLIFSINQSVYAANNAIETHLHNVLQDINAPITHIVWLPIDADEKLEKQAQIHTISTFSDLPVRVC